MSRLPALPLVLALVSAAPLAGATSSEEVTASFRHVLGVRLDPAAHALEVEDTITFRAAGRGSNEGRTAASASRCTTAWRSPSRGTAGRSPAAAR